MSPQTAYEQGVGESEVKTQPIKISIDDAEYAAFTVDHSWNDVARWIVAHGPSDLDAFKECLACVEQSA